MPDVDVVSIGLLCLVILLGGLLLYVLSILKGIQSDNASQRSTLDEIKTQNAVQKEAIDNLDTDVKQEVITAGIAASGEVLKGAVAGTMKDLKISEDIANIKNSADLMASEVADINKIFYDKQDAAGWAEIELETRLKDNFREVNIRKKVAKLGAVPDAHLILTGGKILCIDSKFPSKSFKAMIPESEGGLGEEFGGDGLRKKPHRDFLTAISGHFEKVAKDYVRPDLGTTKIAYMYVASERIYHHMVSPDNAEESEIVRQGANNGVVLCSPGTLIANMHLVRIAEQAMGIADKSEDILKGHIRLRQELDTLSSSWSTLSGHISNSYNNRSNIQDGIESIERTMKTLETLNSGDND